MSTPPPPVYSIPQAPAPTVYSTQQPQPNRAPTHPQMIGLDESRFRYLGIHVEVRVSSIKYCVKFLIIIRHLKYNFAGSGQASRPDGDRLDSVVHRRDDL